MRIAFIVLSTLMLGMSAHDFHVSMARMAVENEQAILQIRLFQDDLEMGLQQFHNIDSLKLAVDPQLDSLFTAYINTTLIITYGDEQLMGSVATSGEDVLYGYPVWWYTLTYKAPASIDALHIDNQVLMEVFEDQQNVLRVTHYPSEKEKMYYLVPGNSDLDVSF